MWFAFVLAVAAVPGALAGAGCLDGCSKYSPNKIDYHDTDVAPVVLDVHNETACCNACREWNAKRPAGSADSTNCTIAVWHGPGHYSCNLKNTAKQPFNSTAVVYVLLDLATTQQPYAVRYKIRAFHLRTPTSTPTLVRVLLC